VFGPGFGESIVAHLGHGQWIVIDSCVSDERRSPKAIEYFKLIGVTPAESVCAVIATHWHDDHVAGLSELLKECQQALFCCPIAMSHREFIDLAELYKAAPGKFSPGPKEIQCAMDMAANRSKQYKRQMLRWAKADSLIWASQDKSVKVIALSPSDEMTRRSVEFMTRAYSVAQSGGAMLDRLTPNTPNDTAAAIRIEINGNSVLLGSDLESGKDPLIGWAAVLASRVEGDTKSSVYKVAHHGSKSGHHDKVWSDMLEGQALALISPFRWGKHRIPTGDDRLRILSVTNKAYITAHPDKDASPVGKRSTKVEALIRQTLNERRSACGPVGHIRWRAPISNLSALGSIELFDGALALSAAT